MDERERAAVDTFIAEVFRYGWDRHACNAGTPGPIVEAFWRMVEARQYRAE